MKTKLLGLSLCALVLGAGLLVRQRGRSVRRPAVASSAPAPLRLIALSPTQRAARRQADAARLQAVLRLVSGAETPRAGDVALSATQVLARVNGVAITGRDLLAFGRGGPEQRLARERFEFLLERAIDRALTVQVARAQGVTLTEEERQQIEALRQSAAGPAGARDREQVELEIGDLTGRLLLAALARRAGVASPDPDESDVERYSAAHREELAAMRADPARRGAAQEEVQLEIRKILSRDRQAQYREQVLDLLGQLKESASLSGGAGDPPV